MEDPEKVQAASEALAAKARKWLADRGIPRKPIDVADAAAKAAARGGSDQEMVVAYAQEIVKQYMPDYGDGGSSAGKTPFHR